MKRFNGRKPTKLLGSVVATIGLIAASLFVATSAANASDEVGSSVSYTVEDRCYSPNGLQVLVTQVVTTAPNEVISDIRVNDLTAPSPDVKFRLWDGTYTVTFDVTNTATGAFFDNVSGPSFTVPACPVDPAEPEFVPQTNKVFGPLYNPGTTCQTPEDAVNGGTVIGVVSGGDAPGEREGRLKINGVPTWGDNEVRRGPGSYSYSYVVTNLNSTSSPQQTAEVTGSFTVVACDTEEPEVPHEVAPTVTGAVGTPSTDPSGVKFDVTVDLGTSKAVQVNIGHGDVFDAGLVFTESGTKSVFVSLKCATYEFGVFLADSNVGPSKNINATIPCVSTGGGEEPPATGGGAAAPQKPVALAAVAQKHTIPAGDTGSSDFPLLPTVGGVMLLVGAALVFSRRRKESSES